MSAQKSYKLEDLPRKNKVYSIDGEKFFHYTDFLTEILSLPSQKTPVFIYEADKISYAHKDFINADQIIENMLDLAQYEYGLSVENYLDGIEELKKEFRDNISNWLDKKGFLCPFLVSNIEKVYLIL